jgi:1-deoxy-D-xylulose-5-phosphate synthase
MRCIPNMVVASPMNEEELRNLMYTFQLEDVQKLKTSFTIRYPRGEGVMPDWRKPFERLEIGKGRKIKDGEDVAILTIGHIGNYAVKACEMLENEGISAAHYDLRYVKPLDEEMLHEVFQKFDKVVTVEDGCLMGGMGSAVVEFMTEHGYMARVKRLGIPDRIVEHGEQIELHRECGFDPDGILNTTRELVLSGVLV